MTHARGAADRARDARACAGGRDRGGAGDACGTAVRARDVHRARVARSPRGPPGRRTLRQRRCAITNAGSTGAGGEASELVEQAARGRASDRRAGGGRWSEMSPRAGEACGEDSRRIDARLAWLERLAARWAEAARGARAAVEAAAARARAPSVAPRAQAQLAGFDSARAAARGGARGRRGVSASSRPGCGSSILIWSGSARSWPTRASCRLRRSCRRRTCRHWSAAVALVDGRLEDAQPSAGWPRSA